MSAKNQISIEIPQAVIDTVTQKLLECKTALAPYVQGLTDKERQVMFKMGDKTIATVQKTKRYVDSNPEFIPAYMDKVEFLKDEAVLTQLDPISNLAKQITTDVTDTVMLAGSEAIKQALFYYGMVKEADSKGALTAKPIYDDLKERFARKSPKKKE